MSSISSWGRLVAVSLIVTSSRLAASPTSTTPSANCNADGNNNSTTDARLAKWAPKWKPGPGKTAWHLGQVVHPRLQEYEDKLFPTHTHQNYHARVLIPLAGKSHDVAYLARRGHRVVAVEGIKEGIDEFEHEYDDKSFISQYLHQFSSWMSPPPFRLSSSPRPGPGTAAGLEPRFRLKNARYVRVAAGGGLPAGKVLWLEGDFLLLAEPPASAPVSNGGQYACPDTEPDGSFDAVFDRGGMVAVDPSDRAAYAAVITRLVAPGGRVLLVAVEHPPFAGGGLGPPYNLDSDAMNALFSSAFEIEVLKREDRLSQEPVWIDRGCAYFNEVTYLLTRKGTKVEKKTSQ